MKPQPAATLRVVLDTNVLLSLYVFADSRFAPLRERLERGEWRALTDQRCLREYQRVIARPQFGLDEALQAAAFDAYAATAEQVTADADGAMPLPQCDDPDDQKFLEVARDGAAQWLITSDKALLKLARKKRLEGRFRILTPDAALEA